MKTATATSPAAPCHSLSTPNRRRVRTPVGGPSLTRQEFSDECDINKILRRYQQTGALTHFATYAPQYGDFNACDLQTAQNLLNRARILYADLPSNIRAEFPTPELFFSFVQNPSNKARMAELGLIASDTPPKPPSSPEASQGA